MDGTGTGTGVQALINALADLQTRSAAARDLANAMGCEDLIILVRDPEVGILLPAPGMPKTLHGGPLWREFLHKCPAEGSFSGDVDLPMSSLRKATSIACGSCVAVLLGGDPEMAAFNALGAQMVLIGGLLNSEQSRIFSAAEAASAREAAKGALEIAHALDRARSAGADLNQQLQSEHKRKDEYLAMLAHELRNPLSPLVSSVEILRRLDVVHGGYATRHLDVMSRQLAQLKRLVDDLMDVSRVSRGKIELRRENVLLADVLQFAMETARPLIDAKGHKVLIDYGNEPVIVHGDRVRLAQVFVNLLHNAAKYTEREGQISVQMVLSGGWVSVVVRDNGIGIPADMIETIFDLFNQVKGSLNHSEGGLGIGLTLARSLLELHGGGVSAESGGRGSAFTAKLPVIHGPQDPPVKDNDLLEMPAGGSKRGRLVEDNAKGADCVARGFHVTHPPTR